MSAAPENEPLLQVTDLRTYIGTRTGTVRAVDGVDLTVLAGRTLCVVGESGCGKSLTALSIMGLLAPSARIMPGGDRILFARHRPDGAAPPSDGGAARFPDRDDLPGSDVIPEPAVPGRQPDHGNDPAASRQHARSGQGAGGRTTGAGREFPLPQRRVPRLSASALRRPAAACDDRDGPELRPPSCSSPTSRPPPSTSPSGPDPGPAARAEARLGMAVLLTTHDFGVVAEMRTRSRSCTRARSVERGPAASVLAEPHHPYAEALVAPASGDRDAEGRTAAGHPRACAKPKELADRMPFPATVWPGTYTLCRQFATVLQRCRSAREQPTCARQPAGSAIRTGKPGRTETPRHPCQPERSPSVNALPETASRSRRRRA